MPNSIVKEFADKNKEYLINNKNSYVLLEFSSREVKLINLDDLDKDSTDYPTYNDHLEFMKGFRQKYLGEDHGVIFRYKEEIEKENKEFIENSMKKINEMSQRIDDYNAHIKLIKEHEELRDSYIKCASELVKMKKKEVIRFIKEGFDDVPCKEDIDYDKKLNIYNKFKEDHAPLLEQYQEELNDVREG